MIKIFSVYHKPYRIFSSECLVPIQVGAWNQESFGLLHDNTGNNIADKNGGYCELTAQYWVWKNYLPTHLDLKWVGFCHYRRFMDFWNWSSEYNRGAYNYRYVDSRSFALEMFPKYTEAELSYVIPDNADIVLPRSFKNKSFIENQLSHYMFVWGNRGLDEVCSVINSDYVDYKEDFKQSMSSRRGYHGLTYLMKTPLFVRYAQWMFDFLEKINRRISKAEWYSQNGRWEGLIGELIFNTWLYHEIRVNELNVVECNGVMLDEVKSERSIFRPVEKCAKLKSYLKSRIMLYRCGN